MNDSTATHYQQPIDVPLTEPLHPDTIRYHYLDNLRALALMLGIFFHAALAYTPFLQEVWLVANSTHSRTMEYFAFFSHLFRMPLFMLIAGFFACYLLKKRGFKGFIKNRSVRILAPLFIFLPLTIAAFIAIVIYASGNIENKSIILQFFMDNHNNPDAPKIPFSTMHLWFLFNLLLFYIAAMLITKMNLFSIQKWLSHCSATQLRIILLLVLPLILVPSFYAQALPPLAAPDRIYPQLWAFGYYGIFFLVGWIFFTNQNLLDSLKDKWQLLIGVAVVLYGIVFTLYPESLTIDEAINPDAYPVDTFTQILTSILHALIATYMVLGLLLMGKKLLNTANGFFRYMADASYWIYLIHLPIILLTQMILLDKEWNLWLEFLLTSFVTFAIGILSYQILVRYTPIGWLLNGRKKHI